MSVEDFQTHRDRAAVDRRLDELRAAGQRVTVIGHYGDFAVVDCVPLDDRTGVDGVRVLVDPSGHTAAQVRSIEKKLMTGAALSRGEALLLAVASGVSA